MPQNYKSSLDAYGYRYDKNDRAELCKGTVEYLVPDQYSIRALQERNYVFLIDASEKSIQSGLFESIINTIKLYVDRDDFIDSHHKMSKLGIITYDSQVHFYNINNVGEDIPAVTMSDVDDPFAPLPASALLINVAQGKDRIMQLIDMLVEVFLGNPKEIDEDGNGPGSGLYRGPNYLKSGNAFGAAVEATAKCLDSVGGEYLHFSRPYRLLERAICKTERTHDSMVEMKKWPCGIQTKTNLRTRNWVSIAPRNKYRLTHFRAIVLT